MREENKDVEKFLCVVIERGVIAGKQSKISRVKRRFRSNDIPYSIARRRIIKSTF